MIWLRSLSTAASFPFNFPHFPPVTLTFFPFLYHASLNQGSPERTNSALVFIFFIYICIYIYKGIYYKELAHGIAVAEKSHDLPSVKWRPRRANGGFYPKSKGLRTRKADGVNLSLRAREDQWLSSSSQAGRADPLSVPLCSVQALSRPYKMATHTGEGNVLYLVYQFKC